MLIFLEKKLVCFLRMKLNEVLKWQRFAKSAIKNR